MNYCTLSLNIAGRDMRRATPKALISSTYAALVQKSAVVRRFLLSPYPDSFQKVALYSSFIAAVCS